MRKLSLAQAPRSICLQRSQQKGRYTLAGLYTLFPPQLGQVTMRACEVGAWEWGILDVILLLKSGGPALFASVGAIQSLGLLQPKRTGSVQTLHLRCKRAGVHRLPAA